MHSTSFTFSRLLAVHAGLRYNAAKGKLLLSPQNPSPVFLTPGVSATYAKVGEADTLGIALDDVLVHTRPGPRGAT